MRLWNSEFHKNINEEQYKSKPQFHRFYDHNELHIESETHSKDLNCLFKLFCQAVLDCIKIISIFDFVT